MVENGLLMYIWIGPQVQHSDIQSIWGVNSPLEVLDGPIPVKDSENNSTLRITWIYLLYIYLCTDRL